MEHGAITHDGPKDEVLAKLKAITQKPNASKAKPLKTQRGTNAAVAKSKAPTAPEGRVTITRGSAAKTKKNQSGVK